MFTWYKVFGRLHKSHAELFIVPAFVFSSSSIQLEISVVVFNSEGCKWEVSAFVGYRLCEPKAILAAASAGKCRFRVQGHAI